MSGHRRDITVVGAGPVGLTLALALARRGRDVLVLEKEASTARTSRAPAIWPPTQEILADLGVLDAMEREGIVLPRLALHDVDRERTLLAVPLADELAGLTPHPRLLVLPQARTEALLLEALRRQPTAEVRFRHEVVDLEQEPTAVHVRARGPDGETRVTAALVAGCDGAHSAVREALGASLEGKTYRVRAALADVRLGERRDRPSPRITTRPRLAIGIRMGSDLWRMILPFAPGDGVALDRRVAEAAASLFGGSPWRSVWRSEFRLHRRVASTFARGRVVLAGDAAHLNSPVGGQGMNVGIEDAALLADVVDAALEDTDPAPEPFAEYARHRRRAIAAGVNRFTDVLTRLLLLGGGRWIRPVLRLASLATTVPPLRRRLATRLAMLGGRR